MKEKYLPMMENVVEKLRDFSSILFLTAHGSFILCINDKYVRTI